MKKKILQDLLDPETNPSKRVEFISIKHEDLSGLDCRGVTFFQVFFSNVNLSDCNFEKAQFFNCTLRESRAIGSNFSSSIWRDNVFTKNFFLNCNFEHASFKNSNWDSSIFHQCSFKQTMVSRSGILGNPPSNFELSACRFIEMNLAEFNFHSLNLAQSEFIDCNLQKICWKNADLQEAVFSRSNLSFSDFTKANLKKSMFKECDLTLAYFWQVDTKLIQEVRNCIGFNPEHLPFINN